MSNLPDALRLAAEQVEKLEAERAEYHAMYEDACICNGQLNMRVEKAEADYTRVRAANAEHRRHRDKHVRSINELLHQYKVASKACATYEQLLDANNIREMIDELASLRQSNVDKAAYINTLQNENTDLQMQLADIQGVVNREW